MYSGAEQDEEKENIETENQNFYKIDVIHSVFLNNPYDFDLKFKPSAIRENKHFSLDSRQVLYYQLVRTITVLTY